MVESAGVSGSVPSGYSQKTSGAKPTQNRDQKLDPGKISLDGIKNLNPKDLNRLLENNSRLLTLSEEKFAAITLAQIKTIDMEIIPKIPSNLIKAMTLDQIKALEWWQVQVLTGGQIASLTKEQIGSFTLAQSKGLVLMLSQDIDVITQSDINFFLKKLELNNPVVYAEVITSMNNPGSKFPLSR
jgi:hypothetical protein